MNNEESVPSKIIDLCSLSPERKALGEAGLKKLRETPTHIGQPKYCIKLRQYEGIYIAPAEEQCVELYNNNQIQVIDIPRKKTVANFTFKITTLYNKIMETGTEKWLSIDINYNGEILSIDVRVSDYKNLYKEITKKYPQCYSEDLSEFSRIAAREYGLANRKLCKQYKYEFGGWYKTPQGIKFLHDGMENVHSIIYLCYDVQKAGQFLPNYWLVSSEHSKLTIVLLYTAWANLSGLFEEAHMQDKGLRCTLYLAAPTGTGKTTLAKIMCKALLRNDVNSGFRFEDTIASLQEGIISRKWIVTLIDDFFAQGTKNADAAFKNKASEITRIAGDGKIKGKIGANRKPLPDRSYFGGLILTGEYLDLNTYSSHLRCWSLNFPAESIKFNKAMTFLTTNTIVAKSFFSLWIQFLEDNQANIIELLPKQYETIMQQVKHRFPDCKHARFYTNVTSFLLTAKLLTMFCEENKFSLQENLFTDIWEEAEVQLRNLVELSPEEVFQEAVSEAVDNGELNIAQNEEDFFEHEFHGYQQENDIFVISSVLDTIIEAYAQRHSYGIKFNKVLKESLNRMRILEMFGKEFTIKYSKNRLVDKPKRPRLYKLLNIKGE